MTPEQIDIIQRNFEAVAARAEAVATLFYKRLFIMQPVLRLLFPADLSEQKKKLMATLALAIKSLRDTEKLIPVLEDLGRRHALYGVRDEYYETVGAALLESLREALGEEFTSEGAAAWGEMYGFVAATMKNAAREMSEHPERSKTIEEPPKMSNPLNIATQVILTSLLIACLSFGAIAQKESASRGRPANRAIAANGSFQMKFALYDAQGDQIGQTKENQSGAPAD